MKSQRTGFQGFLVGEHMGIWESGAPREDMEVPHPFPYFALPSGCEIKYIFYGRQEKF